MERAGDFLVGLAGLEPATFRPPDGRATRLRYSPTAGVNTDLSGESKAESTAFYKLAHHHPAFQHLDAVADAFLDGGQSAVEGSNAMLP